jgi:hypothetical protein
MLAILYKTIASAGNTDGGRIKSTFNNINSYLL